MRGRGSTGGTCARGPMWKPLRISIQLLLTLSPLQVDFHSFPLLLVPPTPFPPPPPFRPCLSTPCSIIDTCNPGVICYRVGAVSASLALHTTAVDGLCSHECGGLISSAHSHLHTRALQLQHQVCILPQQRSLVGQQNSYCITCLCQKCKSPASALICCSGFSNMLGVMMGAHVTVIPCCRCVLARR